MLYDQFLKTGHSWNKNKKRSLKVNESEGKTEHPEDKEGTEQVIAYNIATIII